jgi:hypothetical protein
VMTADTGLLSLAYRVIRDVWPWAVRRIRGIDQVSVIQARKKRKAEFEEHFPIPGGKFSFGRVIIRDIARLDVYPKVEVPKRGISPWFRVHLAALYHRGVMIVVSVERLEYLESVGAWRLAQPEKSSSSLPVYLVGKIKFENIVEVEWNGDEYYGEPQLFCRFSEKNHQPYESLAYYAEYPAHDGTYFTELASHDEIRRNTRKFRKLAA